MILLVEQLQKPTHLSIEIESRECDLPADIGKVTAPISLDTDAEKIQTEVRLTGRIRAQIEMTCSRCLRQYQERIDDAFEVIYLPHREPEHHADEVELTEEDVNVSYYHDEAISLIELVREQLLLWLPVKPLCREDCAGLCSSCGQDLNDGACRCPKQPKDPRLAALGKLLQPRVEHKI